MRTLSHINNLEKKRSKWRCYSEFSGEPFSYKNIYFEFVNILTVLLRHVLNYSLMPVGWNENLKP